MRRWLAKRKLAKLHDNHDTYRCWKDYCAKCVEIDRQSKKASGTYKPPIFRWLVDLIAKWRGHEVSDISYLVSGLRAIHCKCGGMALVKVKVKVFTANGESTREMVVLESTCHLVPKRFDP